MTRRGCIAALLLATGAVAAPDDSAGDPLRSSACRQALDALQAAEDATTAQPGLAGASAAARASRLGPQRLRAARACLASRPDAALPPRPPAAPSPSPLRPRPLAAPAAPPSTAPRPLLPPPVAPPRAPVVLTSCDAQGCWASDGTRLQRAGPQLIGPRGICTSAGALLNCP